VSEGIELIVFPVGDLDGAKAVFGTLLGGQPYVDAPYYVGYRVGAVEVGLDPSGHARGLTAPVAYTGVPDISARLGALVESGAEIVQEPTDVGGGKLVAVLRDRDGNLLGLTQNP